MDMGELRAQVAAHEAVPDEVPVQIVGRTGSVKDAESLTFDLRTQSVVVKEAKRR